MLQSFLTDVSRKTDDALDKLIPSENTQPIKLYQAVRHSIFAGGKRFRPALVFAVGKVFGVEDEKLFRTASAIEMIHTYSLIHDDLPAMDDDDLRRGRPTCHKIFGEATAILAGDILQSLAFKVIAEDENLSDKIKIKLVSELADSAAKMVDGQQLDLDAEGEKISVEDLETIHRNKTGALVCVSAQSRRDHRRSVGKRFKCGHKLCFKTRFAFSNYRRSFGCNADDRSFGKNGGQRFDGGKSDLSRALRHRRNETSG